MFFKFLLIWLKTAADSWLAVVKFLTQESYSETQAKALCKVSNQFVRYKFIKLSKLFAKKTQLTGVQLLQK